MPTTTLDTSPPPCSSSYNRNIPILAVQINSLTFFAFFTHRPHPSNHCIDRQQVLKTKDKQTHVDETARSTPKVVALHDKSVQSLALILQQLSRNGKWARRFTDESSNQIIAPRILSCGIELGVTTNAPCNAFAYRLQLGLAFSGAKRGEEYGLRLQKNSQLRNPTKPVVPKDGASQDAAEKACQKRTRRRRRPKKQLSSHVNQSPSYPKILSKKPHDAPMTKRDLYFCLRCGVVVVGKQGVDSAVGRVVLVNWDNETVFDKFVKVPLHVADYRTPETGITEGDLSSPAAITFDQARKEVGRLIKGKILIGHGLEVDLASLGLTHPWSDIRDTATYPAYMAEMSDSVSQMLLPQELAILAKNELNQDIGNGPTDQARVCLELYKAARANWEAELIQLVQQKERQRQMVMSMRASGQGTSKVNGISVPLSAIRENDNVFQKNDRLGAPSCMYGPSRNAGYQNWVYHHEDEVTSDTSYFSFDTDIESSMSSTIVPELSDFTGSPRGRTLSQSRQDELIWPERNIADINAVALPLIQNHQSRALEMSQASAAASNLLNQCNDSRPDIWGISKPLGCASSPSHQSGCSECTTFEQATTESLRHETHVWSRRFTGQDDQPVANVNDAKTHLIEDEELLRHLPSALIADLDQDLDAITHSDRVDEKDGKEKNSIPWYRTRRRQKSLSDFGIQFAGTNENQFCSSVRTGSLDRIHCDDFAERKQPGIWFRSLRRNRANSLPIQPVNQDTSFIEEGVIGSVQDSS